MKKGFKVFHENKYADLETKLNAWLEKNPAIEVKSMTHTEIPLTGSSGGMEGVTVVIYYHEE